MHYQAERTDLNTSRQRKFIEKSVFSHKQNPMLRFFFIFSFLISSFSASSHEYYFGFAEVEYKSDSKVLEATLILSTHDVESFLFNNGVDVKHLEDASPLLKPEIGEALMKYFSIKSGDEKAIFILEAYEVQLNGVTNFYFTSEKIELTKHLELSFDILFKEFPKQQNKITFIYKNKTYTEMFMPHKAEGKIELES